jgi:uncharacterized membrane protein YphA (DoxX/SURF4 family)
MTKTRKIIYWIATLWLSLGMTSTGLVQITKMKTGPSGVDSIRGLGYPIYFLTIIGIWKILGSIAVLVPGQALVKEWAYAGFFFLMSGAVISHLMIGEPLNSILPALLLLALTLLSWYFRPAGRKVMVNT